MTKLFDSVVLRAFRGEKTDRIPLWFMRQAGRYLPEYRELRAKHSMLDLIRNANLAAEVTLQPLRRFKLDAAIIFADILNPLIGMGIDLDFVAGEGPKIFNLLASESDVEKLKVPRPEDNVAYTLDAIRIVSSELSPQGIPLLGFAGAPFTLSSYMIEGTGSNQLLQTKAFMRSQPQAWSMLQEKLCQLIGDYLVAQVKAGASAVQIFDSWVGVLSPSEFNAQAFPILKRLIQSVRERVSVPVIYFSTGTAGILDQLKDLGASVIGLDWKVNILQARQVLGPRIALQGNLDPSLLSAPTEYMRAQALDLLGNVRGMPGYVFNLGHGILPNTPLQNVELLLELVKKG